MNNTKYLVTAILLLSLSVLGFNDAYTPKYKMVNDVVIKRNDGALYLKGLINIKFKNDVSNFSVKAFNVSGLDNSLAEFSVTKLVQRHPLNKTAAKRMFGDEELAKIFAVYYTSEMDPTEVSKKILEQNKDILDWAEPDLVYEADFIPNDPNIGSQYHINFRIAAYNAWDFTQGDTNVVIGIVDSGSDLDHPDLAANIKYNYAENPTNGLDDDNNGYIDDWRGWDFAGANYQALSEDNNPNIVSSYCEHGSHVSGCASQVTNNGINGAGIGFKCKLLISKHGADNDNTGGGYSYVYNTNAGLTYCYQNGAKVMNCSFGSTSPSSYTQLVINNAWAAGVVTCASAGNDGQNVPRYPASYQNVISVASNPNDIAEKHVFNPVIDVNNLHKYLNGSIVFTLTHPSCGSIRVQYNCLKEFETSPSVIIIRNAVVGEIQKRTVYLTSNYNQPIEIESISSDKGIIKVIDQEKTENRYKLVTEIAPPLQDGRSPVFSDTMHIKLKGKELINISCRGFYKTDK